VCGILADKDIHGIAQVLAAEIDAWILVALAGPRAISTREIAALLPVNASVLIHAADVAQACRAARAAARPGDRVLVFGSFLTVGPALEFLGL
jgi:dihydrofolate synthase/folylpolyglutamate synthase